MRFPETLLKLVQKYGTVREMNDFLRARGLAGSSTWAQLIDDRIRPALANGQLSEDALIGFLRDAEEYGRQHVFLFVWRGPGHPIPSTKVVTEWLKNAGAADVQEQPAVLELPERMTCAEVRRERIANSDVLTIKFVERRIYDTFLFEREVGDDRYIREYQREQVRAVNIVRIHAHGLVEIRVYSHKGASRDYRDDVTRLHKAILGLVDLRHVYPMSLVRAKNELYSDRHNLKSSIAFTGTHITNSAGNHFTAGCSRQENLFADPATDKSLAVLVADGEGYHDSLNLWWLAQERGRPKEQIHVLMSGEVNEFAVTQQCSRGDYEFILAEIRKYNR